MTKTCPSCSYTGELTWRDGKYHCAMCDREISEDSPVVQKYQESVVQDVTCPICKNSENNLFNGARYRCALCGTSFDEPYEEEYNSYYQPYSGTNASRMQRIEALREEKRKYLRLGVIFIFFFYPAAIYFFYKLYKVNKELKTLE